jgi:hypothetical protein
VLGIRGAWQNELDRAQAARFTQIFTTHLASLHFNHIDSEVLDGKTPERERSGRRGVEGEGWKRDGRGGGGTFEYDAGGQAAGRTVPAQMCPAIRVIVGFDGRQGSTDIFSGVVSAACQNGCQVMDVGRSTYGSLHEALRSDPAACAAIFVTGAGGSGGDIGLDVFDRRFEAVSVPWHKYGVTVFADASAGTLDNDAGTGHAASESGHSAMIDSALRMIRRGQESEANGVGDGEFTEEQDGRSLAEDGLSSVQESATASALRGHFLRLPEQSRISFGFRTVRTCAEHCPLDFEAQYWQWLQRWYPPQLARPVVAVVHDGLVAERLHKLNELWDAGGTMHIVETALHREGNYVNAVLNEHLQREGAYAGFAIGEDDRKLSVLNRSGREIGAAELCSWINRAVRSAASHVTAHVSPDGDRATLLDISRPGVDDANEVICDSLAIMGLVLRLLQSPGNSLPV